MSNIHPVDREDAKRWDALPFHELEKMSFVELGRVWRKRVNGERISKLMLLNAHGRMPAQKQKAQLSLRLQVQKKVYTPILHQKESIFNVTQII